MDPTGTLLIKTERDDGGKGGQDRSQGRGERWEGVGGECDGTRGPDDKEG